MNQLGEWKVNVEFKWSDWSQTYAMSAKDGYAEYTYGQYESKFGTPPPVPPDQQHLIPKPTDDPIPEPTPDPDIDNPSPTPEPDNPDNPEPDAPDTGDPQPDEPGRDDTGKEGTGDDVNGPESGGTDPDDAPGEHEGNTDERPDSEDSSHAGSQPDELPSEEELVDAVKEAAKEAGVKYGKDKIEEWAKKTLEKIAPAVKNALDLAKKMLKGIEAFFTGVEVGQDLKAVGDGYREGERNEAIIPTVEKWTTKGAEAVGNAVPGSEYVPGYGEAVKQTSEQAGKDTAHVLKTIQDGGFRSKDTLREFKSQNPELDLPTS